MTMDDPSSLPERSAVAIGLPISRDDLEQMIEEAINILDQLDGDPDLEPSLGYYDATQYAIDAEEECEDEGAQCDDDIDSDLELSMGWAEVGEGAQPSSPDCHPDEEENAVFPSALRSLDDERAATAQTCERFAAVISRLTSKPIRPEVQS